MTAPPQKLYARFVRRLLPLLALTFVLAAISTAWVYYQYQKAEAHKQRAQTMEVFTQVLVKPLWDCDSLTARGIIEAMILQPNVLGASAPDQCTQKTIKAGQISASNDANTSSAIMHYVDEFGRSHALGNLNVAFHPNSVFTTVSQGLVRQLTIFVSTLAAVLASALWIFRRTVITPLEQLRNAMRNHEELDPVPAGWTEEIIEVTQTYNAQLRELRHQARHDPLTSLGNRLLLEERLQFAIMHAQRMGTHGHVLLLDLNHFKSINDTWGHAAGDEVLRTVAQRLMECVRASDTVARLGGDEFVIVTSDPPDSENIDALAKRLKHSLSQPISWQDSQLHVSASIGVARFIRDGDTSSALLAHADEDMYNSK